MWFLIIGLAFAGIIAAIAGYFRNRKLKKQLESGEIDAMPEIKEIPQGCCGQHEVCEKDSLLAGISPKIVYFEDEELDLYKRIPEDEYTEEQVEEFREILYTLQQIEVAPWLRSLQLREIALPNELRDEALLLVQELRTTH